MNHSGKPPGTGKFPQGLLTIKAISADHRIKFENAVARKGEGSSPNLLLQVCANSLAFRLPQEAIHNAKVLLPMAVGVVAAFLDDDEPRAGDRLVQVLGLVERHGRVVARADDQATGCGSCAGRRRGRA